MLLVEVEQAFKNLKHDLSLRSANLGAGAVRGLGSWNMDLAVAKSFLIRETIRFQFRGDLLNILNHTNCMAVDTNIESSRFGQITGTAGARHIQFRARLTF